MVTLAAGAARQFLHLWSHLTPTERGTQHLSRRARNWIPQAGWNAIHRTPAGLKLQLDLADDAECAMAFGLHELYTCRHLRRLLRPGNWFVDCGAGVGYFTLMAAKWVGIRGKVDAFELEVATLKRLQPNIDMNGLTGRIRVHAARPGAMVRVDEKLAGVPDVIRIDKGIEPAAINGMSRFLAVERPPTLIIERGHSTADVVAELQRVQSRYHAFRIGWRLHQIASAAERMSLTHSGYLLLESGVA